MTDDEIMAAVERRLKEVEAELPPTPIDPSVRPGVSARPPTGRTITRSTAGGLLAAVVVVAVAIAGVIVIRPSWGSPAGSLSPNLGRSVLSSEGTPSTAPPAPSGSTPPGPIPPGYRSEVVDGLEILRGAWDGESLLAYRMGWGRVFAGPM